MYLFNTIVINLHRLMLQKLIKMNDSEKKILEKIKNLRNQNKLSQKDMADTIGISQTGYAKIERGDTENIPLYVAVGIAKTLKVGFNELFEIANNATDVDKLQAEINNQAAIIKDKNERIKEKDTLIKSISGQNRQLKHLVIFQIDLRITRDYTRLQEELKSCTDTEEKRLIQLRIDHLSRIENSEFAQLEDSGIIDEEDIKEHFESEKWKLDDPYILKAGLVPFYYLIRNQQIKDPQTL